MKKRIFVLLLIFVLIMSSCTYVKKSSLSQENQDNAVQNEKEESTIVPETPQDILPDMSAEEAREVNIFLSNFSEAYYVPEPECYSPEEALIDFAFIHCKINSYEKILYEEDYMGITATDVDAVLNRFFGKTVAHKTPKDNQQWIYRDGKFLTPAADGESYGTFSIATQVRLYDNGNYEVAFNVYNDREIGGGDVITDKTIYSLAADKASEKYALTGHGAAVLKPKKYNGKDTYELVSYAVENL